MEASSSRADVSSARRIGRSAIRVLYLCGSISTSLLGLTWVIANASAVPAYGDTNEYLELARTLHVDQFRTVLYPGLLRLCGVMASDGGPPFPGAVYAIQWGVLLASTAIFTIALANSVGAVRPRWRTPIVLVAIVLVVTNPLIAHFALSLMTDSLASSFTMGFVGSVALTIDDGLRARPRRRLWLGIALVYLMFMAASRVEKLYVAAALVFLTSVWLFTTRPRGAVPIRRVAAMSALFAAALAAVALLNHATQTPNPSRRPFDLSSMAFDRVVWPRLARVHPYLSPEAQGLIPLAAAVHFDSHNNNTQPLVSGLLQHPDGRRVIDEITVTTLRTFPLAVLGKTVFDGAKYALPNLAFPLEWASLLPESMATSWTVTRMDGAHPRLTHIALFSAESFFLLLQLPLALAALLARRERPAWRYPIFALTAATVLISATMFSLQSGMDAHIRYALPAYVMIHACVVFLSLVWVCDSRAPLPPDR